LILTVKKIGLSLEAHEELLNGLVEKGKSIIQMSLAVSWLDTTARIIPIYTLPIQYCLKLSRHPNSPLKEAQKELKENLAFTIKKSLNSFMWANGIPTQIIALFKFNGYFGIKRHYK
jgi:hypothetical protein